MDEEKIPPDLLDVFRRLRALADEAVTRLEAAGNGAPSTTSRSSTRWG